VDGSSEGATGVNVAIKTAIGTSYQDTGCGQTHVHGNICRPNCVGALFTENFVSSSLLPIDTTGKATGGGQILNATTQQDVTFGFEVPSTNDPNSSRAAAA
jgi:hypothetical protein